MPISKMTTLLLVVMVTAELLPSSSSLTEWEMSQFSVRMYKEQNTKLQGSVTITKESSSYFSIQSNGIPDHPTGIFPGQGNPNEVMSQTHSASIVVSPTIAATHTCLPMGAIGYSKNGIPIYNPLNSQGKNAVEGPTAERFDSCNGHPDRRGRYHYHQNPVCLLSEKGENDEFIGIALDGFPIYGNKDCNGDIIKSSDLDNCHGRIEDGRYRYRVTTDYPYILGCFKGIPSPDIQNQRLTNNCEVLNVTSRERVTKTAFCAGSETPSSASTAYERITSSVTLGTIIIHHMIERNLIK